MGFTLKSNVRIITILLLSLVATQIVFTILFNSGIAGPRPFIWRLEAILFTILAAFAGAAMVQAKYYHLVSSTTIKQSTLRVYDEN